MRLAVSVIAWKAQETVEAVERLNGLVDGLEAVPTRLWGSWARATSDVAARWREELAARGLSCPALQSLLYGLHGATVTGGGEERRAASEHLVSVAAIAGALGATVAVFGSPTNRRRGDLSYEEASRRTREALLPAADAFAARGAALGIEANPPEYGCDFLTTYAEVAEFVERVEHPGVVRHLDIGALLISGEVPDIAAHPPAYVHLSAPSLVPFAADPPEWHAKLVAQLREIGYDGWFSIEQKPADGGLDDVARAARTAGELLHRRI